MKWPAMMAPRNVPVGWCWEPLCLVFGRDGVKVLVAISEVKSRYRSEPVDAAFSLPSDMLEKVRSQTGRTVSFTGELTKIDAYKRRVFLTKSRLDAS